MVPPPRPGTFSPNPAQTLQTGLGHSTHPAQSGALSAGASPSTSSPTGNASSLAKIAVTQVSLLLSTIKDDKDKAKFETQIEQLRKVSMCVSDDVSLEAESRWRRVAHVERWLSGPLEMASEKRKKKNSPPLVMLTIADSSSMITAWKYFQNTLPASWPGMRRLYFPALTGRRLARIRPPTRC